MTMTSQKNKIGSKLYVILQKIKIFRYCWRGYCERFRLSSEWQCTSCHPDKSRDTSRLSRDLSVLLTWFVWQILNQVQDDNLNDDICVLYRLVYTNLKIITIYSLFCLKNRFLDCIILFLYRLVYTNFKYDLKVLIFYTKTRQITAVLYINN